ncbi:SAM and HD domain containing deoxynucleoside triphosphate triphosphohydrolase falten isoform X4 [Oratosquilla oratoria]|uniref:SAM and HD domain containing deoxynucleoside triphosphate triphosphohydrolase falten isoform X4 n=1 Tax=Oratosquilla oratoria TaxID=337810 RepID=UPI003F75FF37
MDIRRPETTTTIMMTFRIAGTALINAPAESRKVFHDAVHGSFHLHPLLVTIIDTPEFQRLRLVKQLGATSFVYPSAGSHRFEHSLGVCYLAGQLVRALQERQKELDITDTDVLCVELAGLCHDIGHGPFSHLWEKFLGAARVNNNHNGMKTKHEQISVKMFEYLLDQNERVRVAMDRYGLTAEDIEFVKEQIAGPLMPHGENEWPYRGRKETKSFLYEIVANKRNGVDVDKWDYFLRDGHNLGIRVTFDYKRLVNFSRVIRVDNKYQICVRDKVAECVYEMFETRQKLHVKAYQHRVVKIIDSMICDVLLSANQHLTVMGMDGKEYILSDAGIDMSAYVQLTDSVLQQVQWSRVVNEDMRKAQKIIQRIFTRDLYVFIGETWIEPGSSDVDKDLLIENILEEFRKRMPTLEPVLMTNDLEIQQAEFSYGMKDKNPVEELRFYNKGQPDEALQLSSISVSRMRSKIFEEKNLRLICKLSKRDPRLTGEMRDQLKQAFLSVCNEFNLIIQMD